MAVSEATAAAAQRATSAEPVSHLFDAELLLRSLAALVAVIGLMLAAAWVLRRLGARGGFGPLAGKRRLAIVEAIALDARSRLVLVRRDDREHLLVLSQGAAVLVEGGIAAPPAPPAPAPVPAPAPTPATPAAAAGPDAPAP